MIDSKIRKVFDVLAVLFLVILIWRGFNLPILTLIRDDEMVLTERAWFSGNLDWLSHLLFFNQARFTAGGDYMLVRPVLFFHTWVMDVLFRADRETHYWVSFSIGIFSAGSLFLITRRFIPIVGAAAIAASLMLITNGRIVFEWSHISVYLLSISFFGLGYIFLIEDLETRPLKISWRSFVLLLLSTLCHEIAALAIFALCTLAFFLEYVDRKNFVYHLAAVLIAYLTIYATVMLLTRPPGFFSPGEFQSFKQLFSDLDKLALLQIKNTYQIALKGLLITGSLLILLFFFFRQSRNLLSWKEKWIIVGFGAPIVALTIGLLFGRVLTRGGYSPWYNVMYMYFGFVVCAVVAGFWLRKGGVWRLTIWALIVILYLSNVWYSSIRSGEIQERNVNRGMSDLVSNIKLYFRDHQKECLAGMRGMDPVRISELNTILYYWTCGHKNLAEAVYLNITDEKDFHAVSEKSQKMSDEKVAEIAHVQIPKYIEDLNSNASKNSLGQYWWSRTPERPLRKSDRDCFESQELTFSEASLNLSTEDIHPILYNFSIQLLAKTGEKYMVMFRGNLVELGEIKTGTIDSRQRNSTSMYLNSIPKHFIVSPKSLDEGTEVFFNEQLLGILPTKRGEGPYIIRNCPFQNNTPNERVKSISYRYRG